MSAPRAGSITLAALALALAFAFVFATSAARADFPLASLVSGTSLIPFEQASSPALAAQGRYIVFQGSLAGNAGVYRRDLRTGEVRLVAGVESDTGAGKEVSPVPAPDARAPSVSADGRYVTFTTTADLEPFTETSPGHGEGEPASDKGCPEVYVRDMDLPLGAPGAFTLASALSGSGEAGSGSGPGEGIAFAPCPPSPERSFAVAGAQAAAGVALSADGRHVVFTVLSPSDLTTGDSKQLTTEPSQVAVRDLDTGTTTLVSATPTGAATPGGGAFPSTQSEQLGTSIGETTAEQPVGSSAAISADAGTVAWLGANIPLQVPPATDVLEGMSAFGRPVGTEVEPLWRRVREGSLATTRRLLNGAGLNFYFSQSSVESEAANAGSLYPTKADFVPPVLSADGATVAVIANAPTAANEGSYQYLHNTEPTPAEAYVIHVTDDPAFPPQVTPLTATPDFAAANATADGISDLTLSADGERVAFNTRRTSFALAPPTLISPPAPEGPGYTYEANLALGTLQRVTSTYDGAPPTGGNPQLLSFSGDGDSLAFASAATNLFFGDGTPGSQVYLVQEIPSADKVAAQSTSPAPRAPLPIPNWILSVTATAQPDGSVLVDALAPGAGRLGVRATAQLPGAVPRRVRRSDARGTTRRAKLAKHAKRTQGTGGSRGATVPARTVALSGMVTAAPSELRLRVRVTRPYRVLVAGRSGLYALLSVSFTARGHKTLVQEIPVSFRALPRRKVKR